MLSLEEAGEIILAGLTRLGTETVPLMESDRRILAEPFDATVNLPSFDNSAMDGYAVLASDTLNASADQPKRLRIATTIPAGKPSDHVLKTGECARIFTGSPLPQGADAVVMQEDIRIAEDDAEIIELTDPAGPWEHVRLKGEDVKCGTRMIEEGTRLGVAHVALLAAQGRGDVVVGRRPIVRILSTGTELTDAGTPLLPGHIYESNRKTLAVATRHAGGSPFILPFIDDSMESTKAALKSALEECDVLITSGGVSVGEHDLVKEAFSELGGVTEFWQLAIRPGKPFVFGRLDGKLWFGLPGNPISALVTYYMLVRPALLRLQGARDLDPTTVTGTLKQPVINHTNRRHFLRVLINTEGEVESTGTQSSHTLKSLVKANGLLDVPAATGWRENTKVKVMLLES